MLRFTFYFFSHVFFAASGFYLAMNLQPNQLGQPSNATAFRQEIKHPTTTTTEPSKTNQIAERSSCIITNENIPEKSEAAAPEHLEKIISATAQGDAFKNWILTGSHKYQGFDLAQEMQDRFSTEGLSQTWADNQEQYLRKEFTTNPILAGAALQDIKCRSSKCQITLNIANVEQANLWVAQTADALNLAAENKMIVATPLPSKNTTYLYIDMDGKGFSFQPEN